jgi:hypothetical protein
MQKKSASCIKYLLGKAVIMKKRHKRQKRTLHDSLSTTLCFSCQEKMPHYGNLAKTSICCKSGNLRSRFFKGTACRAATEGVVPLPSAQEYNTQAGNSATHPSGAGVEPRCLNEFGVCTSPLAPTGRRKSIPPGPTCRCRSRGTTCQAGSPALPV